MTWSLILIGTCFFTHNSWSLIELIFLDQILQGPNRVSLTFVFTYNLPRVLWKFEFLVSKPQNWQSLIFSSHVQMQISQDWYWAILRLRGVLESGRQAESNELIPRSLTLKTEPQEHCKDTITFFISMILGKTLSLVMCLWRPKKVSRKLLKDSLSNGPYLVSYP